MGLVSGICAALGVFLMLTAAIGIMRWSDTYVRLHCAGKSASLGIIFLLAATAIASGDPLVALRCAAAALFFLITAPIGCHALARVLWRSGYGRDTLGRQTSEQTDVVDDQGDGQQRQDQRTGSADRPGS